MVSVNTQPGGLGAGLAKGLTAGLEVGSTLQSRVATQRLTSEQQAETARKNTVTQAQAQLAKLGEALANTRTATKEGAPATPKITQSLVDQFVSLSNNLAGLTGRPLPQGAAEAQARALLTAPSPQDIREQKALAIGSEAAATTEAAVAALPETAMIEEQTAAARAAGTAAGTPAGTQVVQTRDKFGNVVDTLVASDTGLPIRELGRGPSITFQPTELPSAATGATPAALRAQGQTIEDLTSSIARVSSTIDAFKKTKAAGGILGTIIENVGGLLGQIPLIGEDVAGAIGTPEVTNARTQARLTTASLLSTITGEESGRFTDTERRIAEEALKALTPTASASQIQDALGLTLGLLNDSRNRQLDSFLIRSEGDLATPVGRDAFNKVLLANGFTREEAINAIADMIVRAGG